MQLYHFTGRAFLPGIMKFGLILGKLPVLTEDKKHFRIVQEYQWLTTNENWVQSWESISTLPYHRNVFRLTIAVPDKFLNKQLYKWSEFCKQPWIKPTADELNYLGDFENWYIFHGKIPRQAITLIEENPVQQLDHYNFQPFHN